GGILTMRLAWYRAAVGCAWISLLTALLNFPCWPVAVGLAGWAAWWLRKRRARDAFALAEPSRLTADGRLDVRWIRYHIRPIGFAFLSLAALCWIGMIGLVGFANSIFSTQGERPRPEILFPIVGLFWLLGALSIVPLGAGILALRRGSYHAVAGAAWLSLLPALVNIPCWPLAVGIAVWLVRQLWRNEVREAFADAQQPTSLATGAEPMLAKPAKYDPFADAPPTPRSRAARALLGLALVLGGLLSLGCLGAVGSYFLHNSGNAGLVHTGRLAVKIPDRRLKATLRLQNVTYSGYSPGAAMQYIDEDVPVVPDNIYRLKAGDYLLTVKSDDVTVFSDNIRVNSDSGKDSVTQVYEVKPGGILNLEVQADRGFVSVEINGHRFVDRVSERSQRMLVVPEGSLRIKGTSFSNVFAEKWLDMKAGEEVTVRVTSQSIEVIPGVPKSTPRKSG
ncbi:MAG: hypothetical protein L0211_25895, partial [Planctomycetaceae bacterium]|nr:hypothetical protein [Planctomycetaceae bacterium]